MSGSLYAQYLLERTDDHIIENGAGFVTYRYLNAGKTVYIIDIYIVPELRKSGAATGLADRVVEEAKSKGAVELIGSVIPSTKNSTISLKVLLGYEMTLASSAQDFVIFKKEI